MGHKSAVSVSLIQCKNQQPKQGRGKFIKSQILDQSFKIKSWILDHGIVEGKGGSVNKELEFRSWHWKAERKFK